LSTSNLPGNSKEASSVENNIMVVVTGRLAASLRVGAAANSRFTVEDTGLAGGVTGDVGGKFISP